jgi:hypothetical protein
VHFDYLKVGNPKTIVKTVQEPEKTQILCFEIEPNPSKDRAMPERDNLSFCDEVIKFTVFHIRILKQVPRYLATGL